VPIQIAYNPNTASINITGLNSSLTYTYIRSANDGESFQLPSGIVGVENYYDFLLNPGTEYLITLVQSSSVVAQTNLICGDYDGSFLINSGTNKNQQIILTYDEQISSFKPVRKDALIETIGSKYPFVIRNAVVNYKNMEFSGMITSEMDPYGFSSFGSTRSGSNYDSMFIKERKFREWFESWIADGVPKVFKTATEGRKIVRVHNVSFTPIRQLGRVIYNFSCTITEIADYTISNLVKYKFLNSNLTTATQYGLFPSDSIYPSNSLYPS